MNSVHSSPVFTSKRRKRRQSRSPDIFGGDDHSLLEFDSDSSQLESTPNSCKSIKHGKRLNKCGTPKNCRSRLFQVEGLSGRKILSPVPQPVNQLIKSQAVTSTLKCSTQYSISNSLRSTIESGAGINSRLRSIISANKDFTSKNDVTNISVAGETQVVYTLNAKEVITQPSEFSGPFYGLSEEVWTAVKQSKKITSLYQWQTECLNQALCTNKNLLYSLPTSGGKTLVAEILMIRELLCSKKHCLYVLPYVSIVQEKVRTLSPLAVALNFAVEEFAGNRGAIPPRQRKTKRVIYIATLEKAHGIVNSLMELGRLQEIGLVVVDEVHIVGEVGKRGAVLETLLCKLLLAPVSPRIIAMSATIGNMDELGDFLKADVFIEDFRPVKLQEFVKIGDTLLRVNDNHRRRDNILEQARSLPVVTSSSRKSDPDGLSLLVAEVVPEHSCLVFCPTKKNCESVAQLISRNLPRAALDWKAMEKRRLRQALQEESGQLCPILRSTLPYGIAYHHSGLTADERQLIEEAFLSGILSCLCCTSTLAAGVNLPARRVILRSPFMGSMRLSRARYQQMIGRAGRAGFDTHGESILVVKENELSFVIEEILLAPTDRVESQLAEDGLKGLQHLILGVVALDLAARSRHELAEVLLSATLLGQQKNRLTATGRELIDQSVAHLIDKQLLTADNDDRLEVTKLGRATLKGCVDLERAALLYQDLRQAQAGLVLLSKLHLMYLVTPYDLVGSINPIPSTYFNAFNKLSPEEMSVSRSLGINEAVVVKLMSCQEVKVPQFVLQRFYLTLMLNDLWKGESFWNVSETYGCTRGDVQNLLSSAASFAACVYHFTQELEEFWAFSELLLPFSQELSLCCTSELIPLMELPSVAKGRARLLYKAGFKTLTDVAKADPSNLVQRIEHLPRRIAQQIVAAAKVLVYEKADALREQADMLLNLVPGPRAFRSTPIDDTFQSQASNVSLLD